MHTLVSPIIITHAKKRALMQEKVRYSVLGAAVHEMSSVNVIQHEKCLKCQDSWPWWRILCPPLSSEVMYNINLAIQVSILFMIMYVFHGLVINIPLHH